jgi:endonuclease/exonuclease/phosphatase (EEP) superfamily protein YafD
VAVVPADSFNLFAPVWVFAGLAASVLVLILTRRDARGGRRRFALGVGLVFIVAGMILMAPLRSPSPTAGDNGRLRLISFNMHKDNRDPDAVVRWLRAQRADIIVLLEAPDADSPALAALRRDYPYAYSCSASGKCSTRVFSRFPASAHHPLARGDANRREALSALTLRFRIDGRDLPLTAVHLSHPWPLGDQRTDLDRLQPALAGAGQGGVLGGVLAGDFNSAPWTFAMRRMARAGGLRLVSGGVPTWPANGPLWPVLPLDQIYLGPCLALLSIREGPPLGSDHLPLVADIAFAPCLLSDR